MGVELLIVLLIVFMLIAIKIAFEHGKEVGMRRNIRACVTGSMAFEDTDHERVIEILEECARDHDGGIAIVKVGGTI